MYHDILLDKQNVGSSSDMQIETITIQGVNEWNEDVLIINEQLCIYGVADGASSLVPYRSADGETGGWIASQTVKKSIESVNNPSQLLLSLIEKANKQIGEKMQEAKIDCVKKDHVWTTGAAVIRVHEKKIEYVQSGDCMIIAIYKNGTSRVLTYDHVEAFDSIAAEKWIEAIKSGMTDQKEIRKEIDPIIRANKNKMNTSDGYSILDGSKEAMGYVENGFINRGHLQEIILCTDGLFMRDHIAQKEPIDPMKEIAQAVSNQGLQAYVNKLLEIEEADPNCLQYPRFKKSDDKTAVRIVFE